MTEKSDHDMLVEMHTVLLGANGTPGLVDKVEKQGSCISGLKVRVYVILGLLAGLGILEGIDYLP